MLKWKSPSFISSMCRHFSLLCKCSNLWYQGLEECFSLLDNQMFLILHTIPNYQPHAICLICRFPLLGSHWEIIVDVVLKSSWCTSKSYLGLNIAQFMTHILRLFFYSSIEKLYWNNEFLLVVWRNNLALY